MRSWTNKSPILCLPKLKIYDPEIYDMDGYGKDTNFTQSEVSEIRLDMT